MWKRLPWAFLGAAMLISSLRDLYRQRRKVAEGAPDTRRLRDAAAERSIERGEPAPPVGERH